ncbi:MAG: protein kinase domain-containing protein [Gammaproteobacteria bacterium]
MPAQLEVSIGQFSERGLKPSNEDFHGLRLPPERLRKSKGIAVAIADGVSSSDKGAEAAEACVTGFLEDYLCTPESWSVKQSAERVLAALNTWLYVQGGNGRDPHRGRVNTLSTLVLKSTTAHVIHVGDSRIYRLRRGQMEQLTVDHRVWMSLSQHYLSRAMGADTHLQIDYYRLPVDQGDIFVFTTDGVHDYFSDREIAGLVLESQADLGKAAELIVRGALANSSPDNATCQVLRVESLPSQDPDEVFQELTELPFPPALTEGMIIDGYRVIREIYASKRTQLYLVLDLETALRVVLKTPSVNYEDDPAYIERFTLEEWIGQRIDSPHVEKMYKPTRRRRFLYHVTEYIEGATLRQWMRDHPAPSLEVVRGLVEQIAKGLRAFHRLEMIHQDLKPENIMLDLAGTVKLVDFGSAKVAGVTEIATPVVREQLLGTKNYVAPEYLLGQTGTQRSDIYALGVIAYELLTGQLPYRVSSAEWQKKPDLGRLNYRAVTSSLPDVPPWVDGALRKAVQPDPAGRYEALSEFLYDLRHPNPGLCDTVRKPLMERNPVAFWQGLSGILILVIVSLCYLLVHGS